MITIPTQELAPEIDRCPCCGVKVRDICPVYKRHERMNCKAVAVEYHDDDMVLERVVLIWQCAACGCRWRHGQFTEVAT